MSTLWRDFTEQLRRDFDPPNWRDDGKSLGAAILACGVMICVALIVVGVFGHG